MATLPRSDHAQGYVHHRVCIAILTSFIMWRAALQEYEPADSRETRMLGRYPMRNRFISDYIHSATGKHRSAKQVGSRLQQLRDTTEGRKCKCHLARLVCGRHSYILFVSIFVIPQLVIDVLTRCYRTRMDTGTCNAQVSVCQQTFSSPAPTISCDSSSISSSSASPVTPTIPIMPRIPPPRTRQPPELRMPVYIDILPSSASAASTSSANFRPSEAVRHIHNIDSTVTFVSPSPVNGKSAYIVLLDGAPVHSEDTTLEYVGPYFSSPTGRSPGDEPVLYSTALVPKYWDVLCKAAGMSCPPYLCLVGFEHRP